jgi:hydroxymethylglutaryl-CoA reductase (NADPH)
LTPATVIARRSTHAHLARPSTTPRVNISSTALSTILTRIGEEIPTGELVVKVHSPVHIRVADSALERRSAFEDDDDEAMDDGENTNRFENFLSFWTTIVSDPVMSKWIVLALAASVFLNGYLLKGLGSSTLQRQQTQQPTTVRLEQVPAKSSEHNQTHTNGILHTHTTESRSDPAPLPLLPLSPPGGAEADAEADAPVTPEPVECRSDLEPCRTLDECLEVFNSGPDGLQQLNNEEVILLAQQGKIAAYALEKVLGDLERAVLIRRALICKSPLLGAWFLIQTELALTCGVNLASFSISAGLEYQDARVFGYPDEQLRLLTCYGRLL